MSMCSRVSLAALTLFVASCSNDWFKEKSRKIRRKMRTRGAELEVGESVASTPAPAVVRKGDPPADAPNILLISLDTLRADGIDIYGGLPDNAPNLSKLARAGVYFEHSYAQAPSTSPTHASMFTSSLPSEHGILGSEGRLPLEWDTLAEHMQSYGIRTWAAASSVRFALGVQLNQGFDEYAVFSQGSQMRKSDNAMEVALAAIADQPDRPWFGFLHLMDVHAPYLVREPHQSKYLDGPPSIEPKRTVRFLHKHRLDKNGVTPRQLADLKAMYAGGVSHVDTRIGELVAAVEKLDRPTLIVVTADHGEGFFEKNYLGHGTFVHESIIRVPLIFWGPGLVPEGHKRSTLAQSIDIFPTLSHFSKLPIPDKLRGTDLHPVIQGEGEQTNRTVIAQTNKRQMLVRDTDDGLWKVVLAAKGKKARLYALHDDPLEQVNLAKTQPERVAAWSEELQAVSFQTLRKSGGRDAERWEVSDEERQALEAIGYMDADH